MNWGSVKTSLPLFEKAFVLTLRLSAMARGAGYPSGIGAGIAALNTACLCSPSVPYSRSCSQQRPLLIQLFFYYYPDSRPSASNGRGICAVVGALSILGSAYMSGAFQGGFSGIPQVQNSPHARWDSRLCQMIRHVTLPRGLAQRAGRRRERGFHGQGDLRVHRYRGTGTDHLRDLIGMYYRSSEYLLELVIAYTNHSYPVVRHPHTTAGKEGPSWYFRR